MPVDSEYNHAWKRNIGIAEDGNVRWDGIIYTPQGAPAALDPVNFVVTEQESQQVDWSLAVDSEFSKHSPRNTISGWYGRMDLMRTLGVQMNYGGMPYWFSGIGTGYSSNRTGDSAKMDFTWKGKGQAQKLFIPDQTMPVARDTLASVIAREILDKYGVQHNLSQLVADDWVVPVFFRQKGQPINWLSELLEIAMLEWREEGGIVFTPYLPNPLAGPNWVYDSTTVIETWGEEANLAPIINRVIVQRVAEVNEIVPASGLEKDGENVPQEPSAPGTEVNDFGEYTVTFDPPLNAVSWRVVSAEGGMFSDFRCYVGNLLAAVRDPRPSSTIPSNNWGFGYQSANPFQGTAGVYDQNLLTLGSLNGITKIVFTWGEAPGNATIVGSFAGGGGGLPPGTVVERIDDVTGGYGRIEFLGTRGQQNTEPAGGGETENNGTIFDPGFRAVANNTQSQSYLAQAGAPDGGVRQLEIDASPLIPNLVIAQRYADRYIIRTGRQSVESTFAVPLNPMMRVGHVVAIIDARTGTARKLLVTQVQHTFTADLQARGTSFRGVEYLF